MENRKDAQSGRAMIVILVLLILAALGWWWWKNGGAAWAPDDDPVVDDGNAPDDDEGEDFPDDGDDPGDAPEAPPVLTDGDGAVFSFLPAGDLLPSSGPGFADETVYRTTISFPTEDAVYLNSQVYRFGGGQGAVNGMNGAQCDARNYEYPWQDTFCEKRDRNQPLCPGGGHEGLDIRPHSCTKNVHWAIAVEDARVIDVRRHWVTLQTDDGALYNYLHLNMGELAVTEGQRVARGDRIGKISSDFFKSDGTSVPTTTHLHFEMYENYVAEAGDEPLFTKVNPYMTLVSAYARKLRGEE